MPQQVQGRSSLCRKDQSATPPGAPQPARPPAVPRPGRFNRSRCSCGLRIRACLLHGQRGTTRASVPAGDSATDIAAMRLLHGRRPHRHRRPALRRAPPMTQPAPTPERGPGRCAAGLQPPQGRRRPLQQIGSHCDRHTVTVTAAVKPLMMSGVPMTGLTVVDSCVASTNCTTWRLVVAGAAGCLTGRYSVPSAVCTA